MKPRVVLVLLLMGLGSFFAMGFATKLAFDSSKTLQDVTKFKHELLDRFGDKGVEGVSYRTFQGGVALRIQASPCEAISSGDLAASCSELFLGHFPYRRGMLKFSFIPPPRFGCSAAETFREEEVDLDEVRQRVHLMRMSETIAERIGHLPPNGLRLHTLAVKGRDLSAEIEFPASEELDALPQGLLKALAKIICETYRPARGSTLHLQVFCSLIEESTAGEDLLDPSSPPSRKRYDIEGGQFDFRGLPQQP